METIVIPLEDVYLSKTDDLAATNAPWYPLYEREQIAPGQFIHILRLDKILTASKLAGSSSEAGRKLKEKAVRVNGGVVATNQIATLVPTEFTLSLGRHWRRVRIQQ